MIKENWKKTFAIIWGGQVVSLLTSAIVQYALVWYLTAETKSATVLSIAMLIAFLPMALGSPFIGSIVDRYNRKVIMIISDASIALTAVVLAIIAFGGHLPLWAVMISLFIRSIGGCFHQPCLQAVTPLIVPEGALAKCNGYTYSFQSISLIAGPALAAALFAVLPMGWIILIDVLGAAAGILTIAAVHIPKLEHLEKKKLHVVKDALEGLHVLRSRKGLFLLVFISGLFCMAYIPVSSLYPLMCMGYFGGTATHAAIAEMAFAAGMLVGGLALGVWGGTKNKMTTMVLAIIGMGVCLMIMGILPPTGFVIFTILTLGTGLAAPFFSSLFMTMIQEQIAPEYLGRVLGVSSSIMALAGPLGLIFSGMFAERIGLSNWFLISGIVTLLCAVLCQGIKSVRQADIKAFGAGDTATGKEGISDENIDKPDPI